MKSYHGMQTSCMLMCDDKADFFCCLLFWNPLYFYTIFFDESSKSEERNFTVPGLLSNFVAWNRKLIIYSFFSAQRRHTCLQFQWNVTSVVEFPLFWGGFIVEITTRVHFRACYNLRKYFPSFCVWKKNHKQSISILHFPYLDLNQSLNIISIIIQKKKSLLCNSIFARKSVGF